MSTPSDRVTFAGSFPVLAKLMCLAVAGFGLALCVLLFGSVAWRVFLVSMSVIPVLLLLAWVISRADQVEFDDGAGVIRRRWRRPLSYGEIQSVRLTVSMGLAQAAARTSGGPEVLMVGMDARKRKAFRQGLQQRCESAAVTTVRFPLARWAGATVALLIVGYLAGTFIISSRYPVTGASCQPVFAADDAPETAAHRWQDVSVVLPASFAVEPGLDGSSKFRDSGTGIALTLESAAHVETLGRSARAFVLISGLDREYDLFRYTCCSSVGAVPLLLKAVLLRRWQNPRIFEWKSGRNRVLFFGTMTGKIDGRILISDVETGREVYGLLTAPRPVTVDQLHSLLSQMALTE